MRISLRLDDADAAALRARADQDGVSMQAVVQAALREYIERHSRADLVDGVLDRELPRYAEALERLSR